MTGSDGNSADGAARDDIALASPTDVASAAADVSVIIPNFNYGAYVAEAIESVLRQACACRIETIVVDDGSTDRSLDVIGRYPVTVVAQRNAGVAMARNAGALHAAGKFLLFLDADDVLEPDCIARYLAALDDAAAHVAYAYTQARMFGDVERVDLSRPFSRAALLRRNFVPVSALIRRHAFMDAGGFDHRFGYEDYELWVRLALRGQIGLLVPAPLMRYRIHADSRNARAQHHWNELRWRIRGTYPWAYPRQMLPHPRQALHWLAQQREVRRLRPDLAAAPAHWVSRATRA